MTRYLFRLNYLLLLFTFGSLLIMKMWLLCSDV